MTQSAARQGDRRTGCFERTQPPECALQCIDLNGVAECCARAVRLDVAHSSRVDPGVAIGRDEQLRLRFDIGRGDRVGATAMIFRAADDDAVDGIASFDRTCQRFQDDRPRLRCAWPLP